MTIFKLYFKHLLIFLLLICYSISDRYDDRWNRYRYYLEKQMWLSSARQLARNRQWLYEYQQEKRRIWKFLIFFFDYQIIVKPIQINYVLYIMLTCLLSCLFVAISLINFSCLHNPIRKGAGMFNSAGSVSYVQVVT